MLSFFQWLVASPGALFVVCVFFFSLLYVLYKMCQTFGPLIEVQYFSHSPQMKEEEDDCV